MGELTQQLYYNANQTDDTQKYAIESENADELKQILLSINSQADDAFFKANRPCSKKLLKQVFDSLTDEEKEQIKQRSQDTESLNNLAPKTSESQQTTPEPSTSKDESPSVLENSPNRSDHPNVLPIDELKPKVKQILQRDEKVLDWDVAKELDQPSWNVHEVLKDIATVSHKRMIGYVWVPLGN